MELNSNVPLAPTLNIGEWSASSSGLFIPRYKLHRYGNELQDQSARKKFTVPANQSLADSLTPLLPPSLRVQTGYPDQSFSRFFLSPSRQTPGEYLEAATTVSFPTSDSLVINPTTDRCWAK